MAFTPAPVWFPHALRLCAFVVLPAFLIGAHLVHDGGGHDSIEFYAAARLIAAGENPYGVAEQVRAQRPLREGPGGVPMDPRDLYDRRGYLPYFYPPWLALAWTPLASLNFPDARAAWVFLNALGLALSGNLLGRASDRLRPPVAVGMSLLMMPGYFSVQIGQTPPLILLALVAAWRLLERGSDLAAGFALAWLTVKPQLTVVALPALLLWSARRGRWRVVTGFAVTLCILMLGSTWFSPDWPREMLLATRRTPIPTAIDPSVGVTWFSVLKTLGLSGMPLILGYASAAVPAAIAALSVAWDRSRPVSESIARGVIAAFFVAPYALLYDTTTLLVPLVFTVARLKPQVGATLCVVFIFAPYVQFLAVAQGLRPVSYFWMPVVLAALMFDSARARPGLVGASSSFPTAPA